MNTFYLNESVEEDTDSKFKSPVVISEMDITHAKAVAALASNEYEFEESAEAIMMDIFRSEHFGLVAHYKGEVVAYLRSAFEENYNIINDILVADRFRNMGLGSKLLEDYMAEVKRRSLYIVNLLVRQQNYFAQEWFRCRGFEFKKEGYGQYQQLPQEPALLFEQTLPVSEVKVGFNGETDFGLAN